MFKPLHVLLVDDNLSDAEVISDLLERSDSVRYDVSYFDRLQPAIEHLDEHHADVVLLNLALPDSHGLETYRRIQKHAPLVAVVVLSGIDDASVAMRAVRDGAQEYLVKGQFDSANINRTLRFAVDRAETRRALLESEARYHSMVESLPMNLFRKDLDGRLVFGNRRYCDTLGAPLERLLGKSDYDLFPAELAAKYVRDDQRVINTGQIVEDIEEHVGPDGEEIYVHVMKSPIRDAENNVIGIQGIFWDVSDRKRAESALLEERHMLRSLMDNLPDTIFFKDSDARFLRINRALADMLHLESPEMAIGKTDRDFFPDEDLDTPQLDERRIIETGKPLVNHEEYKRWADGHESWTSTTRMPLRDRHGKIIGTFGISRDITKTKRAEKQLRHAKDEAESASRAKGHFLANISHEVRTPLNAILGLTGLLLQTPVSDEQREYLDMVRESGEELLGLLNDVLDFSKLEAGRIELEKTTLDIRDIIDDTMKLFAAGAHQKGLELVCHVAADVPTLVKGDRFRFRQAVVNLIGNAIKFTDRGDVVVLANVVRQQGDAFDVEFKVTDSGIGITDKALTHIFNPFEQADGSTTRKYGGTGLGLTIAREMVRLMGGEIFVKSTVGQGSCFRFVLPFRIAETSPAESDEATVSLEGKKVLVVDDHAISQLAAVEILQRSGLIADGASEPQVALSKLRAADDEGQPYAAIFCDGTLGTTDGFELAAQIQQQQRPLPTIIMMLTVDRFAKDIEKCRRIGIDGHIMKPVRQSDAQLLLTAKIGRASTELDTTSESLPGPHQDTPLRILVAEDDKVNQKLVLSLLQSHGHDVRLVDNGRKAVEASSTESFDIIVMDLQMPEMDGLVATAEIRRREAGQSNREAGQSNREAGRAHRTPIVALTAHALGDEHDKCLAAGMDGYLTKPLRPNEVMRTVRQLTKGTGRVSQETVEQNRSEAPPAADWETSLAATSGNRALLGEVIDAFLDEAPKMIGELRESIDLGQYERIHRAAHTIKGSVQHFGASQAVAVAQNLEKMGYDRCIEGAHIQLQQLEQELGAVCDTLNTFVQRCSEDTEAKLNVDCPDR